MEPIKIVVTDYIEPDLKWEEEELKKYGHVKFEYHQLKFMPETELATKIGDADMILVNMVKMTAGVSRPHRIRPAWPATAKRTNVPPTSTIGSIATRLLSRLEMKFPRM